MQLSALFTALLLPLMAVAEGESTTTKTKTLTLTETLTLQRLQAVHTGSHNTTVLPTGSTTTFNPASTTTSGPTFSPTPDNAAGALNAANVAAAAMAGIVVVAFL
ncbi:hypothetical protein QBC41DRAFT_300382 [Cercophora samala]|uniref:Uncharacterized protein n=1 Tax=Cercophora samala TaxID=330535 RepID=A0AA39ZIJ3_9PEZI|nr:hypothetical protein QBC41DRAFT_300382 [Cercophora samala]